MSSLSLTHPSSLLSWGTSLSGICGLLSCLFCVSSSSPSMSPASLYNSWVLSYVASNLVPARLNWCMILFTTKLRMCAKQRAWFRAPENSTSFTASLLIILSLLDALSYVIANIWDWIRMDKLSFLLERTLSLMPKSFRTFANVDTRLVPVWDRVYSIMSRRTDSGVPDLS